MMIDALIFDFDGLILDTELPMYRAWCALFDAHGAVPPTIDEWAAEIGTLNGLDLHVRRLDAATREVFGTGLDADRIRGHIRHALAGTGDAGASH